MKTQKYNSAQTESNWNTQSYRLNRKHSSPSFLKFRFYVLLLSLFLVETLSANKYYLSPSGDDSRTATQAKNISTPWFSLNKAWTAVVAGDTIYMRGGTYVYTSPQILMNKSGTAANTIKIWAYPNELPVITKGTPYNYSGMGAGVGSAGIYLRNSSYIQLKGLEIFGFTQENSEIWRGILAYDVNNSVFENLNVHHNGLGMGFAHNSAGNTVTNSDFHHNYDPLSPTAYGNSDGLQFAYIDGAAVNGTNTVTGCRAWSNADDGFDAFTNDSYMIYINCWAFWNGYKEDGVTTGGNGDGFKFGTTSVTTVTKRVVKNCLSFQNRMRGFDQNTAQCVVEMYNNTSYGNVTARGYDFWYGTTANKFQNNISYADGNIPIFTTQSIVDHNTFLLNGSSNTTVSVSAADFQSVNSSGVNGARQSDGSLPVLPFLRLATSSDLINVGVNVGLPFTGSAPDLGAYEANGSSITTGTIAGSPFCRGNSLSVPFTISGTFNSGNVFTAQLSDAAGSFSSPVTIGTLTSTTAGTINATIPTGSVSGTAFRVRVIASNPSTIGSANTSNLVINANATAGLSITTPSLIICPSTTAVFTATPVNGGTSPIYQWKLNGTNVGTNSATYSNSSLANNSVVSCVMTSNASCVSGNPATSNPITMTVSSAQTASVSISATATTICTGTSVTFTAVGTAGGTAPTYQWKVNGGNVGSNSTTYTSSTITNNSIVSCIMTSNSSCVTGSPATSNSISMTVNACGNLPPVIGNQAFSIAENSSNGTAVGQVIASDPNAGQTLTYSILSGNTSGAFAINASTGALSVSNVNALNYESCPAFSLLVKVQDNATSPLSSQAAITVNLIDANEAPLIYNQSFSLAENSPNGTVVGFVNAWDVDAGQTVTRTIMWGNTNGAFSLNSATGQITVANSSALNYEVNSLFVINVKAQDNGTGNLYNVANMTINLTNVNEPPVVQNQSFSVVQNAANGTVVGTVIASDPDAGQLINYSIASGNVNNAFSVNASTGVITVNNSSAVKYSTNPVFYLNVVLKDNAPVQLSSSATMTINVVLNKSGEVLGEETGTIDQDNTSENQSITGEMVVYPNPVSGGNLTITITGEVNEPCEIMIVDMAGRKLLRQRLESGVKTLTVDVTSYPSATYIVSLHSEHLNLTRKFIRN